MVFERKHVQVNNDTPVGSVSGIIDNYNNTNASGYINRIRLRRIRELREGETIRHNDPPPDDS